MQFPESWLREFCNPPLSTQQLADLLTMSGMEVEELRPVAPPFSGVVVAEILEAEPHPQADRLRVCTVDAGPHSDGPLQIVCGAPNARAGIRVPLAMVGAELPPGDDGKPFKIGVGKLRGVESRGMLCSARELGRSPTTTAACWNWPPTRRWAPTCATGCCAGRHASSRSSSRPTWRMR
jgi:phenylalanyl-tRNA synthetase beta chain